MRTLGVWPNRPQLAVWLVSATGVAYDGSLRTLAHSGLAAIYAGRAAARYFGVPRSDPRHPDVWGVVQVGVVYTGGTKVAEHGGANPADPDVPILLYAPGTVRPGTYRPWVETTQIAPTILDLLGLDPSASQGSRSRARGCSPASLAPDPRLRRPKRDARHRRVSRGFGRRAPPARAPGGSGAWRMFRRGSTDHHSQPIG
jgi:hypothetical protein